MINISWEQYISDLDKLVEKLKSHKDISKIRKVFGIPRGGLIPAVYISHSLNISYEYFVPDKYERKFCLLVDDLVDTGTTMIGFAKGEYCMTAVLYRKAKTKFTPDVYVREYPDEWIVFPYEKERGEIIDGREY